MCKMIFMQNVLDVVRKVKKKAADLLADSLQHLFYLSFTVL